MEETLWRRRLAVAASVVAFAGFGAAAAGCGDDNGASEDIEQGAEDAAEETGEAADEATDEAGEAVDDAGDEAEEEANDADDEGSEDGN